VGGGAVLRVIDVDGVEEGRVGKVHRAPDALHAAVEAEVDGVETLVPDVQGFQGRDHADVEGVAAAAHVHGDALEGGVAEGADDGVVVQDVRGGGVEGRLLHPGDVVAAVAGDLQHAVVDAGADRGGNTVLQDLKRREDTPPFAGPHRRGLPPGTGHGTASEGGTGIGEWGRTPRKGFYRTMRKRRPLSLTRPAVFLRALFTMT
jgi:hypothetical protein